MQTTRADVVNLRSCLQRETDLIGTFVDLLQREGEILSSGAENDALTALTRQKNDYAAQLGSLAAERNGILTAMGYGVDNIGLEAVVTAHPDLYDPIRYLLDQTAQASLLNTGNGRIIDRFLSHNQHALDVLKHLTGRGDLYDARGHKQPPTRPSATHIKAS